MKIIDLVQGLTFHKTSKESKFYQDLKRIFTFSSMPFIDPCCDSEATVTPSRFNIEDNVEEYLDPADLTWKPLPSAGDVITDSVTTDLVTSDAIVTDSISEQTSGSGIALAKNTFQRRTATAVNVTATTTAAAIVGGLITSTSAAAVALTTPLATDLATALTAVQGTSIDFMVDNSAGANTVTVTPNTGITAVTAVITGGATMTVASGAVGTFRIFFTSATVAKIARII